MEDQKQVGLAEFDPEKSKWKTIWSEIPQPIDMSLDINELATALSKFQGELTHAPKSSDNPFFHSRYADLSACLDTVKKPLADNGLSVTQLCKRGSEASVTIATILLHSSGQWIRSELTMAPVPAIVDKNTKEKAITPQGVGSCITYARRYSLAAILGLAQADDDANAISGNQPKKEATKRSNVPAPKAAEHEPKNPKPDIPRSDFLDYRMPLRKEDMEGKWADTVPMADLTLYPDAGGPAWNRELIHLGKKKEIGFGKDKLIVADQPWIWMLRGSLGGDRASYLRWCLANRFDEVPEEKFLKFSQTFVSRAKATLFFIETQHELEAKAKAEAKEEEPDA